MELPAERAEFLDESLFYKVVNVLGGRAKRINPSGIGLYTIGDLVERGQGLANFGIEEDTSRPLSVVWFADLTFPTARAPGSGARGAR